VRIGNVQDNAAGVMRGYYGFERNEIAGVLQYLFSLAHVAIEDRDTAEQALSHYLAGLEFADALHQPHIGSAKSLVRFDD